MLLRHAQQKFIDRLVSDLVDEALFDLNFLLADVRMSDGLDQQGLRHARGSRPRIGQGLHRSDRATGLVDAPEAFACGLNDCGDSPTSASLRGFNSTLSAGRKITVAWPTDSASGRGISNSIESSPLFRSRWASSVSSKSPVVACAKGIAKRVGSPGTAASAFTRLAGPTSSTVQPGNSTSRREPWPRALCILAGAQFGPAAVRRGRAIRVRH